MRSSTVLRFGAAITAAALALSLGTGPASAAETSHLEGPRSASPQPHRDGHVATGADLRGADKSASRAKSSSSRSSAAAVNVTKIKAYYAELYEPDVNYIDVEISLTDWSNVASIDLDLKVDGKSKGSFPVLYDYDADLDEEYEWIEVPGDIGLGKSVFTGSTVTYTDDAAQAPTTDTTDSNTFNVRRGVKTLDDGDDHFAAYGASGRAKYFEIYGLQVYSPSAGDFVSLKKAKLQYKKGSKWKTKKTMKLDEDGYGYYSWKTSSKYKYRVYSASSTTFEGFVSDATDKF